MAKVRGLSPWQEEKRYVQALVLHALRGEPLVCKGGTYLWLFHGLDRFSEDLDFSARGQIGPKIATVCTDTLGLFGVESSFRPVKDDAYTYSFRLDSRGPLYVGEPDVCRVRVDISRREGVVQRPLTVRLDEPQYLVPIDLVNGMTLEEVLAEKTRALLRRKALRDLYDAWYLLKRKKTVPDWELISRKLTFYGQRFSSSGLARSIEVAGENWEKELGSIVFGAILPYAEVRADVLRLMEPLGE
ncbi:MAG: nucleotidyl transferase AbiEii/AbiGii toxin family protein [Thaumarchaeota archaeon]|nr:nucleotidyl transferase AbiEii/AbiGii toxin family protein [Nitrososphaerota archaeon]